MWRNQSRRTGTTLVLPPSNAQREPVESRYRLAQYVYESHVGSVLPNASGLQARPVGRGDGHEAAVRRDLAAITVAKDLLVMKVLQHELANTLCHAKETSGNGILWVWKPFSPSLRFSFPTTHGSLGPAFLPGLGGRRALASCGSVFGPEVHPVLATPCRFQHGARRARSSMAPLPG